jgi:hypothetical protein
MSDDEEYVDYAATSMLFTIGAFAWAANAVSAAKVAGTTATLSEFAMYRVLVSPIYAAPAFAAAGWAVTRDRHGAVPPGELGMGLSVTDSGQLADIQRMSWSDLWPF